MNLFQALEIMKTHIVTVQSDSTLADAIDRMDLYQVDELPVVDDEGRLSGMIREYDIARSLIAKANGTDSPDYLSNTGSAAAIAATLVRQSMTCEIFSVLDTDELTTELALKLLKVYRRIPVIDEEQRVVGTLNRVDIIQALFEGTISLV